MSAKYIHEFTFDNKNVLKTKYLLFERLALCAHGNKTKGTLVQERGYGKMKYDN